MIALIVVLVVVVLVASVGVVSVSRRRGARSGIETTGTVATKTPIAQQTPPSLLDTAGTVEEQRTVLAEPVEQAAPKEVPRPVSLRDRLGRTRALLSASLSQLSSRSSLDERAFDELEEALILADVGLSTTNRLLDPLREQLREKTLVASAVGDALEQSIVDLFGDEDRSLHFGASTPSVWMFVGVNGVGKTTTIGKVASQQIAAGKKVVLAAGDTFRAAAGDQLSTWAERSGAGIIRGADGANPSSVVFDAIAHAGARQADLVLVDTAGRLHTKVNLMEELKKMRRIADRPPGEVTEVLLVLDATTGQNGLAQAREFAEAVSLTGVVLTKLDGSAKGGIVLAIRSELDLPIKLVGIGEQIDDLVGFDPKEFASALLS